MIAVEQYLAVEGSTVRLEHAGPRNGALAARLATLAHWLTPSPAERDGEWLQLLGTAAHGSVTFQGAVEGRLREGLVELLRAIATGAPEYDSPATPQRVREVRGVRALALYVTARCPFCPRAVGTVGRLVVPRPDWSLHVQRVDEGPPPPGVSSVPTLSCRHRRWAGPFDEFAVVRWLEAS